MKIILLYTIPLNIVIVFIAKRNKKEKKNKLSNEKDMKIEIMRSLCC